MDTILSLNPDRRGLISVIYESLDSLSSDPSESPKNIWEQELGITISEIEWDYILDLVHSSSICARHSLMQCKILHRAHYTNARLAKIYPDRSNTCNRCQQSPANHTHMFWSCPRLTEFWSKIFDTFEKTYYILATPNHLTALFGITFEPNLPSTTQYVVAFTTLLARTLILLKRKHASPPSYDRWIK